MDAHQNVQLEEVQKTQRQLEKALASRMDEFESRFSTNQATAEPQTLLHQEFADFKKLVICLMQLLQQQIALACKGVDSLEMRSRRKVLLLYGVPEASDESITLVIDKLMLDSFGIPYFKSHLKACHRIGGSGGIRVRPVLLRFCDANKKAEVWSKKSCLKGSSVTVAEFLTRPRYEVFMAARGHFGMKQCWTLDGVINIKTPAGHRVKITTESELAALTAQFPSTEASGKPAGTRQPPPRKHAATPTVTDRKTVTRRQAQASTSKAK